MSQAVLEPWLYQRISARPLQTATDRWTLYDSASTVGALWLTARLVHDITTDRLQAASDITNVSHQTGQVMSDANGERQRRVRELIRLLDEWMDDESGYDEKIWPQLKAALENDRLSSRRLFDD
jgi:hypothetical protein